MVKRDQRPEPDRIDVVIGEAATFSGEIRTEASVRIDGVMEGGRIETLGNVIIGPNARVRGDIRARTVSVSGAYQGDLTAQRVELLEGGRMWGTLRVASFLLDEGGYLHGELIMLTEEAVENPFEDIEEEVATETPGFDEEGGGEGNGKDRDQDQD
ncbi:MAG TPA: polymer-forming cytoskeletal protein [Anaerolineae bacterium]|nr:polymer-forming cytoskeletal protein [Anaerolineae bacterium]